MKTPLRFLKKTALAAIFASSAATVSMADTQPCVSWFRENLSSPTAARWNPGTGDESVFDNTNSRLTVDGSITYQPEQVSTEGNVVVTEATLEFSAPGASLPDVPSGAQAALTVAAANNVTNYYVLGKENNQPAWIAVETSTVAPTDQAVPVKITIDYDANNGAGSVTYAIGETPVTAYTGALANAPASGSRYVSALDFQGNGVVSGILSGTDGILASHKIGSEYYASYVDALEAALADGNNAAVTAWDTSDWAATSCNGTAAYPYEIPDVASLKVLAVAVTNGTGAAYSYIQTSDIDFDNTPFDGVGVYNANPTEGTPFTGTYNGDGYKILNVAFSDISDKNNYRGIFNQVNGGTIKNLTVSNLTSAATSGEYGGAIIGNAGNGATLTNLVAEGSFYSSEKPATHNAAGIVVRASAGGTGTLIKDCTNNADIYGDYTKLGGICALTQYKNAGGSVTFDGCVNNGTLTSARTSEANNQSAITGIAGIVAYTADATVVKDCVNNGTITVALTDQKVGEVVGSGGVETNGSLTDQGGNAGDATKKLLYTRGNVTGFQYATVDNGVATTIAPPYTLAKDTPYLLEGNATPSFTLAAAGDTIAFDTALGYTLTGTGITAAAGLDVTPSTSGTVTTYTAAALKYPAVFLK